ncbi:PREDICTED: GTPase Era, mitochondrial [Polistes dominula]|uniref:GTPase Era, mitochondrial n=1 Tax=Polistes dominula TaxID=743375 RepID=A0ABM1IIH3_POLDO|nr:PREDICTED: GTPase Era, mitochondrial [Polistes dominula]
MLCIIQKRIIQKTYCLTRQFTLRAILYQENQSEEYTLTPETNFTSIRRENASFLRIAIIGAPNAGKSTLINSLVDRSICPTSSKVHTTQTKCDAVYSSENTQLVFVDTPGLVTKHEKNRYKLSNSFEDDPKASANIADIIGVVHDVSNRYTRNVLHSNVLNLLKSLQSEIPTILIINKIDKLKDKTKLLEIIRILTSKTYWPNFSDVFLISALKSDGINNLKEYLMYSAKSKNWQYNEETYTDQSMETIIKQTVRAKLMDFLPNEIPYMSHLTLEHLQKSSEGGIIASVIIENSTKKKSSIIIGKNAERIKLIAQTCEKELQYALRAPVKLILCIKTKKLT